MTDATDVHRLQLTARILKSYHIGRSEVVAILVMDWAVRSPELTATFLENLREGVGTADVAGDDMCAIDQYRSLLNTKAWRSYWTGRSKLNLLKFVATLSNHDLMDFGSRFEAPQKYMRVKTVLQHIQEWTYMGPYLSFNLLRCVSAAVGQNLRDAAAAATAMSSHTRHLAVALNLPRLRKELRRLSGVNASDGLLGFYLCETAKLLMETGVLKAMQLYEGNHKELIKDLSGDVAKDFMHHLEEFGQVPVLERGHASGVPRPSTAAHNDGHLEEVESGGKSRPTMSERATVCERAVTEMCQALRYFQCGCGRFFGCELVCSQAIRPQCTQIVASLSY
jgi:hypothetical protein